MTPTIVDPKYCKPSPSSLETSSVPILASHSPKFSKSILQIACDVGCHYVLLISRPNMKTNSNQV